MQQEQIIKIRLEIGDSLDARGTFSSSCNFPLGATWSSPVHTCRNARSKEEKRRRSVVVAAVGITCSLLPNQNLIEAQSMSAMGVCQI